MSVSPWRVKASKRVLKDRWISVRADTCETSGGVAVAPYYVLEYNDWVTMVVFDHEDRILVNRIYRHGCGQIAMEIPTGGMDPADASPEAAARRELLEETGYTAERFECLAMMTPNGATHTNTIHSFVAYGGRRVAEPKLDPTEDLDVEFMSVDELLRCIDDGSFRSALHISAVLLALRHGGVLGNVRR